MKIVLQVVKEASVEVDSIIIGEISAGFLLLVGIEVSDTTEDADVLINKIINLRTFFNEFEQKYFDRSLLDIKGESLIVSQFTIPATFNKGKRPEFMQAMNPVLAKKLYEYFVEKYKKEVSELKVATGEFGANMKVSLINDGPITYVLNSNDFK